MAIPQAVLKQGEESERLLQERLKAQEPAANDNPNPEPAPVDPPAPPVSIREEDAAYWKQRFDVIQGKYNAEIPALNYRIQDQARLITDLQAQMAQLQQTPTPDPKSALDPNKFREEWGDEIADLVDTVNRLNQENAQLKQKVGHVEGTVSHVRQDSETASEQQFWATLNALVPDWQQVNQTPGFLEWLNGADALSGFQYQSLLDNYGIRDNYGTFNPNHSVERVAAVFNAWKSQQPTPPTASGSARREPNTSRATQPQNGKPQYTRDQVTQFYNDVARGKYRHNPEEARRIEQEILAATTEGRVR
jgi:hypothetical protein